MSPLRVIAGPAAARHLREHGLRERDVRVMVGASGGPKWFVLFGLDQYLCGEFFRDRRRPLHLIGSSAGAWRFACLSRKEPLAASRAFAHAYAGVRFPRGADVATVTRLSRAILDAALPDAGAVREVLDNPVMRLNLVAARARHINGTRNRFLQAAGLGLTAAMNLAHRRTLGLFFERVLFHAPGERPPFYGLDDLPTRHVPLTQENLRDAVVASGSIPLVLSGVPDIAGAGPGMYFDGGITDYHFDIPFSDDGLVLYPHFYPHVTPGWFDKALRWRRPRPRHYRNVVLLHPSPEWVASLPFGRIPDRRDFARLDDASRIRCWHTVLDRSRELADALHALVAGGPDQVTRVMTVAGGEPAEN